MAGTRNPGVFGKWAFFALGISLLHLWLGVISQSLSGNLFAVAENIKAGSLIFYANTLAVDVLHASWNERDFLLKNLRLKAPQQGSFFLELAGPLIVVVLSVHTYSTLLLSVNPGAEYIAAQIVVSLIALVCSYNQAVTTNKRLRAMLKHIDQIYKSEK